MLSVVGATAVTAALVPAWTGTSRPTSVADHEPRRAVPLAVASATYPSPDPTGLPAPASTPVRVVDRVQTVAPVVFLTLDDGVTHSRSILRWFRLHQVPATAFLTDANISSDYEYFRQLQQSGVDIQNHTSRHLWLRGSPSSVQREEICSASKRFETEFTNRPELFRPPFGVWDQQTRTAARRCGIRWIVRWSVVIDQGEVTYQSGFQGLRRGDIVLLHFTPTTAEDLSLFLNLAERRGLQTAHLQEYLD